MLDYLLDFWTQRTERLCGRLRLMVSVLKVESVLGEVWLVVCYCEYSLVLRGDSELGGVFDDRRGWTEIRTLLLTEFLLLPKHLIFHLGLVLDLSKFQ